MKTRAKTKLILAVDAGGQSDPTAVVGGCHLPSGKFGVTVCEIIPVGLSFEQQVSLLLHIFDATTPLLIPVDVTGPGRGLGQLLQDPRHTDHHSKTVRDVTITSGRQPKLEGRSDWTIPKATVVSAVGSALVDIQIPNSLNNRDTLQEQLQNFKSRTNSLGTTKYGSNARNDDLVTALGMAIVISQLKGAKTGGRLLAPDDTPIVGGQPNPYTNPEEEYRKNLRWGKKNNTIVSIYSTDLNGGDEDSDFRGRGWPDR